jgi:hypothetical protein
MYTHDGGSTVEKMVRKQFYVTPDDDRKLKRLAREYRCSEAELIREAIGALPAAEDSGIAALRAAGLTTEPDGPRASDKELEEAEREWEDWLDSHPTPLGLSQAVIEEREERDAHLAGHLRAGEALRS